MPLIRNDEIKAGVTSKLKGNATIIAELSSSEDIKESQYQGTEFIYPAVRVKIDDNTPENKTGCGQLAVVTILVFSEEDSSLEADRIAGIIAEELHESAFKANSIAFSFVVDNIIPAIRRDFRTWQSAVMIHGRVGRGT